MKYGLSADPSLRSRSSTVTDRSSWGHFTKNMPTLNSHWTILLFMHSLSLTCFAFQLKPLPSLRGTVKASLEGVSYLQHRHLYIFTHPLWLLSSTVNKESLLKTTKQFSIPCWQWWRARKGFSYKFNVVSYWYKISLFWGGCSVLLPFMRKPVLRFPLYGSPIGSELNIMRIFINLWQMVVISSIYIMFSILNRIFLDIKIWCLNECTPGRFSSLWSNYFNM